MHEGKNFLAECVISVCPTLAQESFFTVSPDALRAELGFAEGSVHPEVFLGSHSALQQQCAE